jgi:hypothetical protein
MGSGTRRTGYCVDEQLAVDVVAVGILREIDESLKTGKQDISRRTTGGKELDAMGGEEEKVREAECGIPQ